MFRCFDLAVAFADLRFDFFLNGINRRVKVAFNVLGKQVRSAHAEADGTAELFFRHAGMVVFERDARVHDALIHVIQFLEPGDDVIFNRFGERDIVGGENQFHKKRMRPKCAKIQFFLSSKF